MESMIGNEIGVSKMSVYEVGRVAVKTHGREAGVRCVVVDIIDRSFLLVDGPKTRRRRCNVKHLVPTPDKIEMEKGADHKGVLAAIKSANMMKKLEERINLNL